MPKLDEVQESLVQEITSRERRLTPRRERFIKHMIEAPGSPREAAIRAGYSSRSASVLASRLLRDPTIQHELAKHFVDQEQMVSEALASTLARLRYMVEEGTDKPFLQAAKLLLEYTRLAVPVLGLDIKRPDKSRVETGPIDPAALIRQHEEEIERLKPLLARGTEGPPN